MIRRLLAALLTTAACLAASAATAATAAAVPALSVTPTNVAPDASITATWSGVTNATSSDWIGVYLTGAASQNYGNWVYDDTCSHTAGSQALASGSCAIVMPSTAGSYELRLLAHNSYTVLASSGQITVAAPAPATATLAATPASAPSGQKLTITWSGIADPSTTDWVGLYSQGAPNSSYLDWFYDSSCTRSVGAAAVSSGSCTYTLPVTLTPGSYQLRLEAHNGYSVLASFAPLSVTSPSASSGDPVVVAVGDIACAPGDTTDSCRQQQTATLAAAQHPDDVLVLGDNQYNSGLFGEYEGVGAYNASWGVFNPIVHPVPGNHEYAASSAAAGYFQYFGSAAHGPGGYYSFDIGSWHIVALNSNCSDSSCSDSLAGTTSSAQIAWLKTDLAANETPCVLAYWHQPLFSSGFVGDSPGVAPLWNVLYAAHADVVLNGHDHLYERYAQQDPSGQATSVGIREFVVGTGGESLMPLTNPEPNLQFSDTSDFGVLVLTLHADSYSWAFVRTDGTVADSGSTACHGTGSTAAAKVRFPAHALLSREPRLALDVRPLPAALGPSGWRLPLAIHCSRACDLRIGVWDARGGGRGPLRSFWETESQIPRPFSRIVLALAADRARPGQTLILRVTGEDAAAHRSALTRRLRLP